MCYNQVYGFSAIDSLVALSIDRATDQQVSLPRNVRESVWQCLSALVFQSGNCSDGTQTQEPDNKIKYLVRSIKIKTSKLEIKADVNILNQERV